MTRCVYCHRYVWWWQKQGFKVNLDASVTRWHVPCLRKS